MGRHRSHGSKEEKTERLILDTLEEIAAIGDRNGIILDANQSMARRFGMPPEDLIGKCVWDLLPPHLAVQRRLHLEEVLRSGQPVRFEDQNGDRWFENKVYPILDQEGRVARVVLFARDISGYKGLLDALRESEEKYRILFSAESDAIMVHDLERLRYVQVNDAAVRLYGYTADEFTELTVKDITTDFEAAKKAMEETLRKGMVRVPLRWHRKKDGTVFPVEMSGTTLVLKGRRFFSTINRDITERLKVEEGMKRHQQDLEKTVRERTADLLKTEEELLAELEKRRKIEKQLLRHQRRLQILASQLVLSEEEERRHLASYLHDNIGHSLAIAKHRLESISGTEDSREFEREKKDVTDLIQSTIEEARRLTFALSPPILYDLGLEPAVEWLGEKILQENGIEFELETQGRKARMSDEVRILLYQTIKELVVNIVKHAKASRARVMLGAGGGAFTAHVEDDGIGLAGDLQREGMVPGRGYGLFSIRERLQSMGGSMKITPRPEGGTRVSVRVPLMVHRERSERSEDHED